MLELTSVEAFLALPFKNSKIYYTLFHLQNFISHTRLNIAKHQAKATEAELLLFENYSFSKIIHVFILKY